MKLSIYAFIVFFFVNYSYSQVTLIKDSRIDNLIQKQSEPVPPASAYEMDGYRIQVAFESSKSTIDDARARFSNMFPKVDTYVEFKAPYYFLKAGDFRSMLEAERVQNELSSQFPTSFIVKDKINLPRIDQ